MGMGGRQISGGGGSSKSGFPARSFTLHGTEDLIAFIREFMPTLERKIVGPAVRAAVDQGFATPIKKNIRAVTKKGTGNLLKGVKVESIKGSQTGAARVYMGAPAYHAHFFEFGTVAQRPAIGDRKKTDWTVKIQTNKAGQQFRVKKFGELFRPIIHTGGMKRKPFFVPGITDNFQKAAAILKQKMEIGISKQLIPATRKRKAKS